MTPAFAGIRGIAFDMDGVLLHSAPCHRAAFEEVLAPYGIADFDYSRYAGWRTDSVIEAELRRAGLEITEETVRSLTGQKRRLATHKIACADAIPSDCVQVLEALAGRYVLALASSGSRGSVAAFLDASGARGLFGAVIDGDQVRNGKPHPEIYERAFAELGLPARECVAVEDAVAGIAAARAAGARTVAVCGTCPETDLREAGSDAVVYSLSELLPIFGI